MGRFKYAIIILITMLFGINGTKALGSSITTTNVTVGGKVDVIMNVGGYAGSFSITSSDNSILEGGFNDWIEDSNPNIRFNAKNVGTATITIRGTAASNETGTDESYSKSYTVTVRAKPVITLSKDDTLKELTVEGKELSPAFSKDNLEYSLELEPDTNSINVIATPSDGGAKVEGAGTRELQDGPNRLEINVTAENGSRRTYIINASVKEFDPIKVKIGSKNYTVVRKKSGLGEIAGYEPTTIKIGKDEIPALKSKVTKYTLVALKDEKGVQNYYIKDKDNYILYKEYTFNKVVLIPLPFESDLIPKNYVKTQITYNDTKIDAYKLNSKSKYALVYGMNAETGVKNVYMYDSKEDTLQIYNNEIFDKYENESRLYLKILIGISVLSIVLLITLIIVLIKNKKNKVKIKKVA